MLMSKPAKNNTYLSWDKEEATFMSQMLMQFSLFLSNPPAILMSHTSS